MTAAIQTEKLTKSYGSHRGIIEVDLSIAEGETFGFLGPNGAGKTTMIRTLLDTSGRPAGAPPSSASRPRPTRWPSIGALATCPASSSSTTA